MGCNVEIISGIHKDLVGKISSLDKDFADVKLRNEVNVRVEISTLKMLNENEYKRKRSPEIVNIVGDKKKDNMKDKKGKKYRPAYIGLKVSHLKLPDLYYMMSCAKEYERNGGEIGKYFFGSLKNRLSTSSK